MRHANFEFRGRHPNFSKTGVHSRSTMVRLNGVLVSSYRLSIVTMPLTAMVWQKFTMQVFGVQTVPPFGEKGEWGIVENPNRHHRIAVGQPYLLVQTFLRQKVQFTHNTCVTDRRQTDDTSYRRQKILKLPSE